MWILDVSSKNNELSWWSFYIGIFLNNTFIILKLSCKNLLKMNAITFIDILCSLRMSTTH